MDFMGGFNLYKYPENRNRDGADISDMFLFNSIISYLGLSEIPLHGKKFTWSNMQQPPLLEKLDWIFTNNSWTLTYPETTCRALSMEVSDHNPLVISISTFIPKAHTFRFENYWLLRGDFQQVLTESWHAPENIYDSEKRSTSKYKNLRGALRAWSSKLSNLKSAISNISVTLQFIDSLEEHRDLSLEEWNFRSILREKLLSLLEQQRIYWKQRGAVKWATLGDAGTIRHRRNTIASLKDENGIIHTSHADIELLLWESFKERIGQSDYKEMLFDLPSIIQRHEELSQLEDKFTTEEIDGVIKQLPNDKSSGPNGFSNQFIKKCWPSIKHDFYNLC